jgi:hypothetical protein
VKLGLAASQNPYLLNDLLKSEGSSFEKLTHEVNTVRGYTRKRIVQCYFGLL